MNISGLLEREQNTGSQRASFKRMPALAVGLLCLWWPVAQSAAHDLITTTLTYTRDISRILSARCLSCHGAAAAVPLVDYRTVRPWAVAIKEQVLSRAMPPWCAVKGYGEFSGDRALSQEEIMTIAAWVTGGAPEGDPRLLAGSSPPGPRPADLRATRSITLRLPAMLNRERVIVGVEPSIGSQPLSSRVTAELPDGQRKPVIWLYHCRRDCQFTYRYRQPLVLPAGTRLTSTAPVTLLLELAR